MNHNDYKELLSALLDGELNDAERAEVLAHLETCPDCRTCFAELNAMRDAFGDMEPIDVPEGFAAGVMERLHEKKAPKAAKKRNPWRGVATLTACAAVVVLAVTMAPSMFRMGGASKGTTADSAAQTNMAPAEAPQSFAMSTTTTANGAGDMDQNDFEASDEAAPDTALYAVPAEGDLAAKLLEREGTEPEARGDVNAPAVMNDNQTPGATAPEYAAAEPTVLTLSGEGAEDWLRENGTWTEAGWYLVSVETLNELPDSLMLEGVAEPENGMVPVAAETEAAP